jgi:hypothetical protein
MYIYWHPMESAPKDGTWVIALEKDSSEKIIAQYRIEKAGDIFFDGWYMANDYVCFPVCWKPLPKPSEQN